MEPSSPKGLEIRVQGVGFQAKSLIDLGLKAKSLIGFGFRQRV